MKGRRILKILIIILICIVLVILALQRYSKYQMSQIPELSFQEALEYTTKNNSDAVITVGIIKDGQVSYTVYGENGKELPAELHTYEIGSLTKTLTASMLNKAIQEEKLDINDTIDKYLALPEGCDYPTIAELLAHTSGYKAYYFESVMVNNFLNRKNDFYGITKDMVFNKVSGIDVDKDYSFNYSNYGYAVLGLVLEQIYQEDFRTLMNSYLKNDLLLENTKISDKNGNLGNYWDWKDDDAYLPAGAVTSDIADMLIYAQMQLNDETYFAQCHESIKKIDASSEEYKMMGIHIDEIGMAWLLDKENNIIWHNGGTDNYNSYLGFNPKTDTAVVILSNLSPNYRIPSTVLGAKLLAELNS